MSMVDVEGEAGTQKCCCIELEVSHVQTLVEFEA